MTDERLSEFIGIAKSKGMDDASLAALLRQQGWQEQRIYRALAAYYRDAFGIDVPSRGSRAEDARDAFYHLLAFATLGAWMVALIDLVNALVDRALPSPNIPYYYASNSVHELSWYIATIIIAFPIYIWVNALIGREAVARPESLQSGVRKWLTYVALVIAASVLIGDGIWLLGAFLSGSVTTAFVLKSICIIAATGGTFAYYLGGVRATELPAWRNRLYGGAATLVVVVAVALGFGPVGTPAYEQAAARDRAIVDRLQSLEFSAGATYRAAKPPSLPATLRKAKPGDYIRLDARHYRLCSTFEAPSLPDETTWKHPAGHACFDRNVVDD